MPTEIFRGRYADIHVIARELRRIFPNGGVRVTVCRFRSLNFSKQLKDKANFAVTARARSIFLHCSDSDDEGKIDFSSATPSADLCAVTTLRGRGRYRGRALCSRQLSTTKDMISGWLRKERGMDFLLWGCLFMQGIVWLEDYAYKYKRYLLEIQVMLHEAEMQKLQKKHFHHYSHLDEARFISRPWSQGRQYFSWHLSRWSCSYIRRAGLTAEFLHPLIHVAITNGLQRHFVKGSNNWRMRLVCAFLRTLGQTITSVFTASLKFFHFLKKFCCIYPFDARLVGLENQHPRLYYFQ